MNKLTKPLAALLLFVFCAAAWAQEIQITGPSSPVSRGSFAMLTVAGIDDAELSRSQVTITPSEQILVLRMPTQGPPATYIVLVAQDATPGARVFSVSLNPWRKHLDEAAITISSVDEADATAFKDLAAGLAKKYPYRFGSAVLEVAGQLPPPPPLPDDPNKPPPDPSKKKLVTYIYEKDQSSVPRPVSSALQKLNADFPMSVIAAEFENDTVDGFGKTPAQYVIALEAARKAGLPVLIVQAGDVVTKIVKAPVTTESVLEAAK